jgi:PAS domain S-box-containing protein
MLQDQDETTLMDNLRQAAAEDLQRQQIMTTTVLSMMSAALLVFTVPIVIGAVTGFFDVQPVVIMFLIDTPVWVGWWLAGRGHWQPGRFIAPALMFSLGMYGSYFVGLATMFVLFYAIAILLSALLLSNRAMWITVGLVLVVHLGLGVTGSEEPIADLIPAMITFSGALLGLGLLQWFSSNQMMNALDRARTNADRLRAEVEERQRVEEALRAREAQYRLLADNVTDVIWTMGLDLNLTYVSPSVEKLHGWRPEEWASLTSTDYLPPTSLALVSKTLQEALALRASSAVEQDSTTRIEIEQRRKDGTLVWTEVTSRFLLNTNGVPQGLIGVTREIGDRKRAEQDRERLIAELKAKNDELERFTYTVSHDLKAPLITIRGFLGFLEKDALAADLERVRDDMHRIVEATDKMQRLLSELLELSRIGRLMNPPEDVAFETIVREAITLVQGRIKARSVQIQVAADLPTVYGDRGRLLEVVQNLVDNACKFMGDQPEPHITIGRRETDRDGKPIVFVCDNGIGIDPQYHEKVFGLFDKLDPKSEGTGIGLVLVKRIVEVHGGRIWVESAGAKTGTTFYFTLPVKSKI